MDCSVDGDLSLRIAGFEFMGITADRSTLGKNFEWAGAHLPLCPRGLRVRDGLDLFRHHSCAKPAGARYCLQSILIA